VVTSVVFDVGETLVDETRQWGAVADAVGVPRLTVFGVVGGLIERGRRHDELFAVLGIEPVAWPALELADLYDDALPCLKALRADGYRVGIAANQPHTTEAVLGGCGAELDFVATSAGWGAEKPAPEFFARVVREAGVPAAQIAYVGDRLDNDVLPANRAGMVSVFLRRGPWGYLHATRPEAAEARLRIDSLADLPAALRDV
jgi:HAD superfamily hydrolase (TIGR01509 family)